MPGRNIPLISGEFYHVFNRGISDQLVFFSRRDYDRFFQSILYYQHYDTPISYSKFMKISRIQRTLIFEDLLKRNNLVSEIMSFCLMPNHFHLLLRQVKDNGIPSFISNLTNSYTKYFNTKSSRRGPMFQGKFKAVRIETDEQLLHVSRYIHLNPHTAYIVKSEDELMQYPYSSLIDYLGNRTNVPIQKDYILSKFKNIQSFKQFTLDNKDYQRELGHIKHLIFE